MANPANRILLMVVLAVVLFGIFFVSRTPDFTDSCAKLGDQLVVCAVSDMAKISRKGKISFEHESLNLEHNTITLRAARNETLAFQLIVRTTVKTEVNAVHIDSGEFHTDTPGVAMPQQSLFAAHYHWVDNADYSWGPATAVLDWPAYYPDALVPQRKHCGKQVKKTFDRFPLSTEKNENQAIWFDTFIPGDTAPGVYEQAITISLPHSKLNERTPKYSTHSLTLKLELTVVDVALPDKPSIHAVGELYRTYNLEGAGYDIAKPEWQQMAHCYQQLAHQHRMVFIERVNEFMDGDQWRTYQSVYGPALDGSLFTEAFGYTGPGVHTPVAVWRTPWPQNLDSKQQENMSESDYRGIGQLAKQWQEMVIANDWTKTEYFAYIFDEVEGKPEQGESHENRRAYLATMHAQLGLVQAALDSGSATNPIDLIWTSHSNPAQWEGDPELDLTGRIRLWAPNATAADTKFLRARILAGDSGWFYHSGHPAIGAHVINVSGIDMRTWGVAAARYGFQGQLMWAVNLGSDEKPFAKPSYKPDDTRFGNGVMVYPGNQLPLIGYPAMPGPIPSMRLKAWRRGLQDAELYKLAAINHPEKAANLIQQLLPTALSEGRGSASWSYDPADWINFRANLLDLAARP